MIFDLTEEHYHLLNRLSPNEWISIGELLSDYETHLLSDYFDALDKLVELKYIQEKIGPNPTNPECNELNVDYYKLTFQGQWTLHSAEKQKQRIDKEIMSICPKY